MNGEPTDDASRAQFGDVDPLFIKQVMDGLRDTNFAHGWSGAAMYEDFLTWCERSEEADAIIARHYESIPVLTLDEADGVRMITLRATAATELMKALLEAFEQERVRELLER